MPNTGSKGFDLKGFAKKPGSLRIQDRCFKQGALVQFWPWHPGKTSTLQKKFKTMPTQRYPTT